MTFKHEAMLVLIIAKYRLRQELSQHGFVYNRIILAIFFFYFAVLEIHVASKNFGANYIHKQVIKTKKKKKFCKRGSFAPGQPNYSQAKICA